MGERELQQPITATMGNTEKEKEGGRERESGVLRNAFPLTTPTTEQPASIFIILHGVG